MDKKYIAVALLSLSVAGTTFAADASGAGMPQKPMANGMHDQRMHKQEMRKKHHKEHHENHHMMPKKEVKPS